MKASLYHFKTLRDTPSDAELISHKLMIKANIVLDKKIWKKRDLMFQYQT